MSRTTLAFLLLTVIACDRAKPTVPAAPEAIQLHQSEEQAQKTDRDLDSDNLLNIAYGASVISRTAELNLEFSAVHAIDGIARTRWSSPPGGRDETLVFALAAPSRIERLGVTTLLFPQDVPAKVRFEASIDGKSWREVLIFEPQPNREPQLASVAPFDALYLRVAPIEPTDYYTSLCSIHAIGQELAPPSPQSFDGCWTINGITTRLTQRGTRIIGMMEREPPLIVDGGTDGRVANVMWRQGGMWGYAAITLSPDGNSLSGLRFHEEPSAWNVGEAWFGSRCRAASSMEPENAPERFLRRTGRWSMFGLAFDDRDQLREDLSAPTLDTAAALIDGMPGKRFRLSARELRGSDAAAGRKHVAARLAAVRAALGKRGVDPSRLVSVDVGDLPYDRRVYAVQRLLASRVDLELAP